MGLMMITAEAIKQANALKVSATNRLRMACQVLRDAQEDLTDVEGVGSAEAYSAIADLYQSVETLAAQVDRIEPTGMFS